ncbi:MAG: hypothetical protein IKQ83_00705 [Lachnospiraceae bacterium]|nr:hypothetical protein [Lachnospiraceae bacterium]
MWDYEQNSPYVRKPGSGAEQETGRGDGSIPAGTVMPNSMAKAASTMGVLAVVSLFTMLIYPALILGATAIVLALLSRDRDGNMHVKAKNAIATGIVAIAVDAVMIAVAVTFLFSNGSFKNSLNELFKDTYGQTWDDMYKDMLDGSLDLEYKNLPYNLSKYNSNDPLKPVQDEDKEEDDKTDTGLQSYALMSYNDNSTIV